MAVEFGRNEWQERRAMPHQTSGRRHVNDLTTDAIYTFHFLAAFSKPVDQLFLSEPHCRQHEPRIHLIASRDVEGRCQKEYGVEAMMWRWPPSEKLEKMFVFFDASYDNYCRYFPYLYYSRVGYIFPSDFVPRAELSSSGHFCCLK